MKINLLLTLFLILSALAFLSVSDRAESLDISKMAFGSVVQINLHSIIILEDSSGSKIKIEIDSNTVYQGVQQLTDLKAGDKVQVEYREDHNNNIAITVTKVEVEI